MQINRQDLKSSSYSPTPPSIPGVFSLQSWKTALKIGAVVTLGSFLVANLACTIEESSQLTTNSIRNGVAVAASYILIEELAHRNLR